MYVHMVQHEYTILYHVGLTDIHNMNKKPIMGECRIDRHDPIIYQYTKYAT